MNNYINDKIEPKDNNELQACTDIILAAYKDKINHRDKLLKLIKTACEKYKVCFVTNAKLLYIYSRLVADKRIKPNVILFELLRKRKIRTASGIASVAVLTKPYKCPGNCLFCPTEKDVPKSYLSNEPAVMRAILAKYDPVTQIFIRIRGLELSGNPADKIELIVMGGTWSYLPTRYQLQYLIGCFWGANNFNKKQTNSNIHITNIKILKLKKLTIKQLWGRLEKEHTINETAKYRIIGLTLETRPDYINEREIIKMRKMGCTRVELGIQSIYDNVLKKNDRGHGVDAIVNATKLLKSVGFKINYHMMPGMYGSSYKKDLEMFKILFSDDRFQPDMLKIYPCVVTKNAQLYKKFQRGLYIPYTDVQLIKLISEIKNSIPLYVRIQRLIRDIPSQSIVAGSKVSNLRQLIQKNDICCQCIRCREIKSEIKLPVSLERVDYDASDGKEIFLQYVDKNNRLYALLRLRINYDEDIVAFGILKNAAIIREVHTYGPMLAVGSRSKKDPQHSGLGKKLLKIAEQIAEDEFGYKKIAIISGIGVRGYYQKNGYKLVDTYMVKILKRKS